jgi:hypothetical protein
MLILLVGFFFQTSSIADGDKKRMMKSVAESLKEEIIASYIGLLKHGNVWKMEKGIIKFYKTFLIHVSCLCGELQNFFCRVDC